MTGGSARRVLSAFAATLGVFAVLLFAHPGTASAQVQTFTYQGPAFDVGLANTFLVLAFAGTAQSRHR